METLAIVWLVSCVVCACIDVNFYVNRNVTNVPLGLFLIFCPVLNIIYSAYIIYRYGSTDFKEFL